MKLEKEHQYISKQIKRASNEPKRRIIYLYYHKLFLLAGERGVWMNKVTIACEPKSNKDEGRVSFNFSTVHLPKEKYLVWHIITQSKSDTNMSFSVKQEGSNGQHIMILDDIEDGFKMPYEALRNLYIASPKNVTGHFLIEVEAVS